MFVTFTRMLDNRARAVCVMSKDQNATVCGNWDTHKFRYGWRADAASPWTYSDTPPDKTSAKEKGPFASLLSALGGVFSAGTKATGPRY